MNGTSTDHGEHPELEELAALIDGRLSEDAAEQLRSHLASCVECREVFLETVDFVLEEEARGRRKSVIPFRRRSARVALKPERSPGRLRRWVVALPAAAALAAGGGYAVYLMYFVPPDIPSLAFGVADDLSDRQQLLQGHFGDRPRGIGDAPQEQSRQSFQLGATLINLQVSLAGKNTDEADAALAKINGLNNLLEPDPKVKNFYISLRTMAQSELWLQAQRAKDMAQRFRGPTGPADDLFLDFGLWAEAGKFASLAADTRFLTSRDNRRFPAYLQRQLRRDGVTLEPEVLKALAEIQATLEHGNLKAYDCRQLVDRYETILKAYA